MSKQPWDRLYSSRRWRKVRAAQLQSEPLCAMCLKQGRVTPANVCDHVEPHKGDMAKFWAGPFQSLCKPCHDRHKQREERGRVIQPVGTEGWPGAGVTDKTRTSGLVDHFRRRAGG